MIKFNKILTLFSGISITTSLLWALPVQKAFAYSVCGLQAEEASFRTENHLITICSGEASYQMIMTYLDGTGYKRMPAEQRENSFSASDGQHNYIIDSSKLTIGTDGETPQREAVVESKGWK